MINKEIIDEFVAQIVRYFNPEKVVLFGSHAYGTAESDSDLDILVILNFRGKSFNKSLEILNRIKPRFAVDLLAKRPTDVRSRYKEGDPLIREALDKGKILYEKSG